MSRVPRLREAGDLLRVREHGPRGAGERWGRCVGVLRDVSVTAPSDPERERRAGGRRTREIVPVPLPGNGLERAPRPDPAVPTLRARVPPERLIPRLNPRLGGLHKLEDA